jgi:hypothetical protein
MSHWTASQAAAIAAPQEVLVVTRRGDGTLRRPTTIWIVRDGERVFIRSTNGRGAGWFRAATATGTGQILVGRQTFEVAFTEVTDAEDLAVVDRGYRDKYGHYASIVDHLEEEGPRSATLLVEPA